MANKYRHKKLNFVVTFNGYGRYTDEVNTLSLSVPMVEDSAEWEEIKPLTDFYGVEIPLGHLAYHVTIDSANLTTVVNNNNFINSREVKIIATFREYNQACQFQGIFVKLQKHKDILVTTGGNPTTYLKNILKTL